MPLVYISLSFYQLNDQWSIYCVKCFCENSFGDERVFNDSVRVLNLSAVTSVRRAGISSNTGNDDSKEKG